MASVQRSVFNQVCITSLVLLVMACGSSQSTTNTKSKTSTPSQTESSNASFDDQSSGNESMNPPINSGSENSSAKQENETPRLFKNDLEPEKPVEKKRELVVSYENKSTSINVPLDLDQPFYLELQGTPVKKAVHTNRELMAAEMRQIMRDFRKAQDLFFKKEFEAALDAVNRSLNTLETADALALKGSIYYVLKNIPKARSYWAQAVKLDPEIVVPEISETPVEEQNKK